MDEIIYDIALSFDESITPIEKVILFGKFNSSEKILSLSRSTLKNILGRKWSGKNYNPENLISKAASVRNYLEKANIKILRFDSLEYPSGLRSIPDFPFIIYCKGDISYDFERSIAVVGTRKPSYSGLKNTDRFTSVLAKANWTIISGLALGIDTQSHQSAIMNSAKTIAVLGCGIDKIYPCCNKNLAKNILVKNGALISEYPPGIFPRKWNFPRRNRIIVGLSKYILIAQSPSRSGSLISAYLAADYNREIFVISPGIEKNLISAGNAELILQGANEVKEPEEIINYL